MKFILALALCATLGAASGQGIPANTSQVVIAKSPSWDSSRAELTLFEKKASTWTKVRGPIQVRLGRNGAAWGRGLHPSPSGGRAKKEGDGRSPAGIFSIGGAWGDAPRIEKHPSLPYRKVTPQDLWVEDSQSPFYNQHRILPHVPRTGWEKKQQMKQNDAAHSLKLFIAHNAAPNAQPKAGSAIFFHIWRSGGSKPTAGCTTMALGDLKKLVAWIDPTKKPVFVLLPEAEYQAKRAAWKLP